MSFDQLEKDFAKSTLEYLLEKNDANGDSVGWLKIGELCREVGVKMPVKAINMERQAFLRSRGVHANNIGR